MNAVVHTGTPNRSVAHSLETNRCQSRSRTRALTEVMALMVITCLLIAGPLVSRSRVLEPRTTTVLATDGDTLWSIAKAHPLAGQSTAQTVEFIAQVNGLDSCRIQAGKSIKVPSTSENVSLALR